MPEHTKETLRVGDESMCVGELTLSSQCHPIYDDDGLIVGITFNKGDACRIVACVNACAGIKTDYLETVVREGSSIHDEMMQRIQNKIASDRACANAEKQRDELLAAAQKALDECCDLVSTPAGDALASAIARATGGA